MSSAAPRVRAQRVAIVVNTAHVAYQYRAALIRGLVGQGVSVHVVGAADEDVRKITALGARFEPWLVGRRSMAPWKELRSVIDLVGILRRLRPDIVHCFTMKPNVYGPLAARLARKPPAISTVTGLGYVYTARGLRVLIIRLLVTALIGVTARLSSAVVFFNPDDLAALKRLKAVPADRARLLPSGSGVDTAFFHPDCLTATKRAAVRREIGVTDDDVVVLMVARMLWTKGVEEFVWASKTLGTRSVSVLVGPADSGNSASIPASQLQGWSADGTVRYLGERDDVRDLMAASDIVVLPSYREGIPRVLLEAAALGKPAVTTDVPGCREVVDHEQTGLLTNPRDAAALAEAINRLVTAPELRVSLGQAARAKAEAHYDERQVVTQYLNLYTELGTSAKRAS